MKVNSPNILRSVINEAGRQADFYSRRQGAELECEFWSELEALASEARRRGHALYIITWESSINPLPIKGGEQGEQLSNPNQFKVLQ